MENAAQFSALSETLSARDKARPPGLACKQTTRLGGRCWPRATFALRSPSTGAMTASGDHHHGPRFPTARQAVDEPHSKPEAKPYPRSPTYPILFIEESKYESKKQRVRRVDLMCVRATTCGVRAHGACAYVHMGMCVRATTFHRLPLPRF